jgi:hypothetical protein
MAEVPGVSSAPDPTATQQAAQTQANASGTVPTTLPANATVGMLASAYKPLMDAIMWAVGSQICDASNRSQQRIHDKLAEDEQAANSG